MLPFKRGLRQKIKARELKPVRDALIGVVCLEEDEFQLPIYGEHGSTLGQINDQIAICSGKNYCIFTRGLHKTLKPQNDLLLYLSNGAIEIKDIFKTMAQNF